GAETSGATAGRQVGSLPVPLRRPAPTPTTGQRPDMRTAYCAALAGVDAISPAVREAVICAFWGWRPACVLIMSRHEIPRRGWRTCGGLGSEHDDNPVNPVWLDS